MIGVLTVSWPWLTALTLTFALLPLPGAEPPRFGEVMPRDYTLLPDEDAEYSGWLELENPGSTPLSLDAYGLSDEPTRPFKWVLPALTLAPGERLVVFLSGKNRRDPGGIAASPTALPTPGPDALEGLALWLDAADSTSLVLEEGHVAEWRDKSGRPYRFEDGEPRSPDQIPDLALWLDASDPAHLEVEDNHVVRWHDRSGHSHVAAQTNPAFRPAVVPTAQGNLPLLRFDGSDDHLVLSGPDSVRTVFWVAREDPAAPLDGATVLGDTYYYPFQRGHAGALYRSQLGYFIDTPEFQTWLNGEPVNPLNTPMPRQLALLTTTLGINTPAKLIGSDRLLARSFWEGEIGEILVYSQPLDAEKRRAVEAYLLAKWQPPRPARTGWRHATQPLPDRRPIPARDPVLRLPLVMFDGIDDFLGFPRISNVATAFAVLREAVGHDHDDRGWLGDLYHHAFSRGDDGLIYNAREAPAAIWAGSTWVDGQPVNPFTTRLPQRLVSLATRTTAPVQANTLAFDRGIAGRVFLGGVGELIVYDRPLSDSEVETIAAYLRAKWRLPARALHTNFRLDGGPATLRLTRPDGALADQVVLPAVPLGGVVGRPRGDADKFCFLARGTPGEPNPTEGYAAFAPTPVVAPGTGFQTEPVVVEVNTNDLAGAEFYYTLDGSAPNAPLDEPRDVVWLDDVLPEGAAGGDSRQDALDWVRTPTPFSGGYCLRTELSEAFHYESFFSAVNRMTVRTGDRLFLYVWLDPDHPPREIVVQWFDGSWDHRAFWGNDELPVGAPNTPGRVAAGHLPPPGQWARLEVPAAAVALEERPVSGLSLLLSNGRVWWDRLGRTTRHTATSQLYTGPLTLTTNTVFRCRAFAPGLLPSAIVTHSYLYESNSTYAVLSLVADPQDLFSESTGIYAYGTNAAPVPPYFGANFWRAWERPVRVEFLEPDGRLGFALDAGLRIRGGWSRSGPQKPLEIETRRRYGQGNLRYPVFPNLGIDEFDGLALRCGDWSGTFFRDSMAQSLMQGTPLDIQARRPAHVYLNGQYWGLYNLREKLDEQYLLNHHGSSALPADLLENDETVVSGDTAAYDDFARFLDLTDLTSPAAYEAVHQFIEVDNFIDWEIIEIYADNQDWPHNNTRTWRPARPDGRWRWMLVDLDDTFWIPSRDTFAYLTGRTLPGYRRPRSPFILTRLAENAGFRQAFINRFADCLNTRLATDTVLEHIDEFAADLAPEIPRHIQRWAETAQFGWRPIASFTNWLADVEVLRNFARERPAHLRELIAGFFQLPGQARIELIGEDPDGGSLRLNSLRFRSAELPWSGIYFRNVPVEVEATPAPGRRFRGWVGRPESTPQLTFVLTEDVTLIPIFEPDPDYDPSQLRPAPHDLRRGDFAFAAWAPTSPAGTFPPHMLFLQSPAPDPPVDAEMETEWSLPYDRTARSRIRGLGNLGVSFLNTSDPQPEAGSGFVGAALVALQTTGMSNVVVSWTGGTVAPNQRAYGIRLQYRLGDRGPFLDVTDTTGQPVEYLRSDIIGDYSNLGPTLLPPAVDNQPLVQLRWKYYFVPTGASGPRAELRLDDIAITASSPRPSLDLISWRAYPGGRLRAQFQGLPDETVRLLTADRLSEWKPVRWLRADATGRIEFDDWISVAAPARFYRLERLP